MSTPFPSHLTKYQMSQLSMSMKVDHRDFVGKFVLATVIERTNGGVLRLHYDGYSAKWDVCTTLRYIYEFAPARSISRRPAHRLKHLQPDDYIEINTSKTGGWVKGKIRQLCQISGQIQVCFRLSEEYDNVLTWVHLDNINEVAPFGTHIVCQPLDPLSEWLQARHCLSDVPIHLKSECCKDIIEKVFDGISNVIEFFIENGTASQSKQMRQIMQQKIIKFKETNSITQNDTIMISNNENENSPKISSLIELSKGSIGNICCYLNRHEIKRFKLTCYKIGIVCLKEMKKYSVSLLNMNQLMNDTNKMYDDMLSFDKFANNSRYIPSTKYSDLCAEWEIIYHIPIQMQIIFTAKKSSLNFLKYDDIKNYSIPEIPHRHFSLLDRRNIIIFDNQMARIMSDIDEMNNKQTLVLLKWFDIFFQRVVPVQFVVVEKVMYRTLFNYVKDGFIATTKQQKIWYDTVTSYRKQLVSNQEQLIMHEEKDTIDETVSCFTIEIMDQELFIAKGSAIYVFQLNTNNSGLSKAKYSTIQEKYSFLR